MNGETDVVGSGAHSSAGHGTHAGREGSAMWLHGQFGADDDEEEEEEDIARWGITPVLANLGSVFFLPAAPHARERTNGRPAKSAFS